MYVLCLVLGPVSFPQTLASQYDEELKLFNALLFLINVVLLRRKIVFFRTLSLKQLIITANFFILTIRDFSGIINRKRISSWIICNNCTLQHTISVIWFKLMNGDFLFVFSFLFYISTGKKESGNNYRCHNWMVKFPLDKEQGKKNHKWERKNEKYSLMYLCMSIIYILRLKTIHIIYPSSVTIFSLCGCSHTSRVQRDSIK